MQAKQRQGTELISKLVKAEPLKAGDQVGLCCPGSRPASPAVLTRAVRLVEEMGFKPVVGKHVLSIDSYMAGTDEERLADLNGFLKNRSVRGIFFVSGGYGSLRLLPEVDFKVLSDEPKVIVGCDDNTHLLLAVLSVSKLVPFHGPNLDQLKSKYSFDRLKEAVTKKGVMKPVLAADGANDEVGEGYFYSKVAGTAAGALLGGNLTAITSLMGTPFAPDFRDAVLFLEDINERTDILERWLTTLYISGKLGEVSGVACGEFNGCGPKGSYDLLSIEEIFASRFTQLQKPSCFGLPLGQTSRMATVPLGVKVSLDASKGVLTFKEPHFA
jgi:muramoyltetrapeptide carboxypeptidase